MDDNAMADAAADAGFGPPRSNARNPVSFWNDVALDLVALDHSIPAAEARAPGPVATARALGLDAGPMSGFDNAGIDAEFFAGSNIRSNVLINLGYGDASKLRDRLPRLPFDRACVLA